jgi:hypothetical protein
VFGSPCLSIKFRVHPLFGRLYVLRYPEEGIKFIQGHLNTQIKAIWSMYRQIKSNPVPR